MERFVNSLLRQLLGEKRDAARYAEGTLGPGRTPALAQRFIEEQKTAEAAGEREREIEETKLASEERRKQMREAGLLERQQMVGASALDVERLRDTGLDRRQEGVFAQERETQRREIIQNIMQNEMLTPEERKQAVDMVNSSYAAGGADVGGEATYQAMVRRFGEQNPELSKKVFPEEDAPGVTGLEDQPTTTPTPRERAASHVPPTLSIPGVGAGQIEQTVGGTRLGQRIMGMGSDKPVSMYLPQPQPHTPPTLSIPGVGAGQIEQTVGGTRLGQRIMGMRRAPAPMYLPERKKPRRLDERQDFFPFGYD